jgi:hypothetical protein
MVAMHLPAIVGGGLRLTQLRVAEPWTEWPFPAAEAVMVTVPREDPQSATPVVESTVAMLGSDEIQ